MWLTSMCLYVLWLPVHHYATEKFNKPLSAIMLPYQISYNLALIFISASLDYTYLCTQV